MLEDLEVTLTVVLGRRRMPIHKLLRVKRGAVLELEDASADMVDILANGHPIARGQVVVTGTSIAVEVTEMIRKPEFSQARGIALGHTAMGAASADG